LYFHFLLFPGWWFAPCVDALPWMRCLVEALPCGGDVACNVSTALAIFPVLVLPRYLVCGEGGVVVFSFFIISWVVVLPPVETLHATTSCQFALFWFHPFIRLMGMVGVVFLIFDDIIYGYVFWTGFRCAVNFGCSGHLPSYIIVVTVATSNIIR